MNVRASNSIDLVNAGVGTMQISGADLNAASVLTLVSVNGIVLLNTVNLTGKGIMINNKINDTLLGEHNLILNYGREHNTFSNTFYSK